MEKMNIHELAAHVLQADPKELGDAIAEVVETKGVLDEIMEQPGVSILGGGYFTPETICGTGGFLATVWQSTRSRFKISRMDMGGFTLKRFKGEDIVELIGVRPGGDTHPRTVFKIVGERNKEAVAGESVCRFTATADEKTLFILTGKSFARLEKTATAALRRWIGEGRRMHKRGLPVKEGGVA